MAEGFEATRWSTEVPAVVSTFSIYYVRGKSASAFEDRSRSVRNWSSFTCFAVLLFRSYPHGVLN